MIVKSWKKKGVFSMVLKLFEQNVLIYGMVGLCGVGIFLKMILGAVYANLLRASDKMDTSKNKLMKGLRTKFETNYVQDRGVNNVDSFVDKYVYQYKVCGILLHTWETLCAQLLLICMLIGSIGAILGLIYECGKRTILFTFFVGITTSAILVIIDNLLNLSTKRNMIKTNIQDYLENSLKVRLETKEKVEMAARKIQMQEKEKKQAIQKDVENLYETSKKEEKIIQDILKEYIV